MLRELKKNNNKNNRKNIIFYTFLFIFFLLLGEFENIKPLQINSISDFLGNDYRRVEFKVDLITDYYLSIENEKNNEEIGIGYLAYDEKSNKYYGIEVNNKNKSLFETALNLYLDGDIEEAKNFAPIVKGSIKKMSEEDKEFFKEALSLEVKLQTMDEILNKINNMSIEEIYTKISDILKQQLNISNKNEFLNLISNFSEKEFEDFLELIYQHISFSEMLKMFNIEANNFTFSNIENEIENLKIPDEYLNKFTDYYYIEYHEDSYYIVGIVMSTIFILITFSALLFKLTKLIKYNKFTHLKEKIETSYDLREEDLQIDFERAYNIDSIWLGSKFSIFLSEKYADFILNDDIIWIYILEKGIKRTKTRKVYRYEYSLIFVDKNGNEYDAKISKQNCTRILNIYEDRYPDLYVGYSVQLESMLKTDINNFYSFDKNTLGKNIIKTY